MAMCARRHDRSADELKQKDAGTTVIVETAASSAVNARSQGAASAVQVGDR